MAISKERKNELVAQYTDLLRNSQGVILTEYRGMRVPQIQELRSRLREVGSTYMVTKNTLLRLALDAVGVAVPDDLLEGPVAVAFAHDDLAATAKAVLDIRKDLDMLVIKGAAAGTSVFEGQDQIEALSRLPTLHELRAQIVGLIVAPTSGLLALLTTPASELVSVINGGATQLLNVVTAYANKEEAA